MAKPVVGDYVRIVFWDHCENFHDAMQFEVVGRIAGQTPKAYVVSCWYYHDDLQKAADRDADQNEHRFSIVKSAVDFIEVLG